MWWVKFIPSVTSFTHFLCYEQVLSHDISSIEWICLCILKIWFCVMSENSFLLPPLPTCCVVNWFSGGKLLWINMFGMLMIGFCVMSENSFRLPPLPTCCVVNWYSGLNLPLNKHVWHTHDINIGFCVMSENSFHFPLYPLAVLWTGALLVGKLPLNEHVLHAEDWIFCDEWN